MLRVDTRVFAAHDLVIGTRSAGLEAEHDKDRSAERPADDGGSHWYDPSGGGGSRAGEHGVIEAFRTAGEGGWR
jgi:hypothetical protein